MKLILLIVFVGVAGLATGQVFKNGVCPTVQSMQNFDSKSFTGRWYEISRYYNFVEEGNKCVISDFTLESDDGVLKVVDSQINIAAGGIRIAIEGVVTPTRSAKEATLGVVYNTTLIPNQNHYVLGCDDKYQSYCVLFGCSNFYFNKFSYQTAWIFSRQPTLSQEELCEAKTVLKNNGLETSILITSDQTGCDY